MRNTLATFGPSSAQYISIKYLVDEHLAKAALQNLSLRSDQVYCTEGQKCGHSTDSSFRYGND